MLRFCVFAKTGKNLSRYTWKKRGKIIINTYICDVLVVAFYIWLNCFNILQSCLVLVVSFHFNLPNSALSVVLTSIYEKNCDGNETLEVRNPLKLPQFIEHSNLQP